MAKVRAGASTWPTTSTTPLRDSGQHILAPRPRPHEAVDPKKLTGGRNPGLWWVSYSRSVGSELLPDPLPVHRRVTERAVGVEREIRDDATEVPA